MTLVSTILADAYRETNLIPLGGTPNTNQTTEALRRLNSIVLSTIGYEAGDDLVELNYGGDYDQSSLIVDYLPDNVRLIFNLDAAATLYLDPNPYDGQRLAFVDAGGNLNTYNVTLDGNGRKIAGAATAVLNTDSDSRQWMYRADTGNWVVLTTLVAGDEMPFPSEFDDFFVISLAGRINPQYGQNLAPESVERYRSIRSRLRARYGRRGYRAEVDDGLLHRRFGGDFDLGR